MLITSTQEVDKMTLNIVCDKPFSGSKWGQTTNNIGNIGEC